MPLFEFKKDTAFGVPWFQRIKKYMYRLQPISDLHCTAMVYLSATEPVDWVQIPCDETFSGVNIACSSGSEEEKHNKGVELVNEAIVSPNMECFTHGILHKVENEFVCILLNSAMDFFTEKFTNITEQCKGTTPLHMGSDVQVTQLKSLLDSVTPNQVAAFIFVYKETCSTLYSGIMPDSQIFIDQWQLLDCSYYANFSFSHVSNFVLCTESPVERNHTCRNGHFTCSVTNTCIIQNLVCDGNKDCPHGEDESVCSKSCPRTPNAYQTICVMPSKHCVCSDTLYFQCTNGERVSELSRCDDVIDCSDHSDEMWCLRTCSSSEFQCKSGQCIQTIYRYIKLYIV